MVRRFGRASTSGLHARCFLSELKPSELRRAGDSDALQAWFSQVFPRDSNSAPTSVSQLFSAILVQVGDSPVDRPINRVSLGKRRQPSGFTKH